MSKRGTHFPIVLKTCSTFNCFSYLRRSKYVHGVFDLLLKISRLQQTLEHHVSDQIMAAEPVEVIHGELDVALTELLIWDTKERIYKLEQTVESKVS